MKTLKMLLAQTAVVCAVGASGEVQVDTKLPAGCVIVQGVEGDTVKLEPNGDRPLLRGEISCRLAMFIAGFVLAYGVCPD